jgi:hypothetical protein
MPEDAAVKLMRRLAGFTDEKELGRHHRRCSFGFLVLIPAPATFKRRSAMQ